MPGSSADSEFAATLKSDLPALYLISYSMSALVAYEYIITISQEVKLIWWRKWTCATWIFMANRYLMIAIMVLDVSHISTESCTNRVILGDTLVIAQYITFAVFSALRIFAICEHNVPVSLLVLVLNLLPAVADILNSGGKSTAYVEPIEGAFCGYTLWQLPADDPDADWVFRPFLILVGRLALILADILVLTLTWRKTANLWKQATRVNIKTPLSDFLLRDGTVYFIALSILNAAQMIANVAPSPIAISAVFAVTSASTPILISRFMLNLRQVNTAQNEMQNALDSCSSALTFRVPTLTSFIGNMGEDLYHGAEAGEDIAEESDIEILDDA